MTQIAAPVEAATVAAEQLNLTGPFWHTVAHLNLNTVGIVIAGLFIATWIIALAIWRYAHIEEKWGAQLATDPPPATG